MTRATTRKAEAGGEDQAAVPRRLLSHATKLFAKKGFDRTSVQEIVEAAGVTKGAMYHYFGSKDDLLYEIYARVLRAQTEQLEKVVSSEARCGNGCAPPPPTSSSARSTTSTTTRSSCSPCTS